MTKLKTQIVSKTEIVMNFKNSDCDETQELKWWQNSKTQIVMKLKNSNGDKTQKLKLWQNSTTEIVTKLKNAICDKTLNVKERKIWIFDKTQELKLKHSNYDKLKTQIVAKF